MPIDVRTYGDSGPEVLVLHGGPGAQGSVAGLARALSDEFRALEPLQRRSGSVPLTVARHVADLAEVAPPTAPIVGCSWGAMLALSFAAAYPDRTAGLVLVGCGTYDVDSRALYEERMHERLGEEGVADAQAILRRIEEAESAEEQDQFFDRLGDLVTKAQAYEPLATKEGAEAEPPFDRQGYQETWSDVLRLQETGQEPLAFSSIGVPVLMLHGADDPHPGNEIHAVLGTHLPHVKFELLDRCGHEPWNERHAREPFLRLLHEHLRRLTQA